jgi:DNA mismatch repair protein PMS2
MIVAPGRSSFADSKKLPLLNTTGAGLTRTFIALFGAKAETTMMAIDLAFDVEPDKSVARFVEGTPTSAHVRVVGCVSKPQPGQGRSSTDRQFFYINGRPFSPTKVRQFLPVAHPSAEAEQIPRAINEVYRSYNANQAPCVVANFIVSAGAQQSSRARSGLTPCAKMPTTST